MTKISRSLRRGLLGSREKAGFLQLAPRYLILIGLSFIYVYPILYMIINSFMSPADLADPSVSYIPTQLYLENFSKAFSVLKFWPSLGNSVLVAGVSALLQTLVTAVVGFGLARFRVPFKKVLLVLIIATFFIPAEVTSMPRYVLFVRYGLVDTLLPSFLPALLGQGISSAIFILVFVLFFNSYPLAFDEAAFLDGAGRFKVFTRIALPMAKPAIVLSFLFSFVWYWNEITQSQMYFGKVYPTLMHMLSEFEARYSFMLTGDANNVVNPTQSITLAGTLIAILPMLLLFLVLQKQFINSVERSGITGE